MNLKQIQYFVAVCEEGSLSAAATRLNCTGPGMSQQMSALEKRLGIGLFERTARGVNPTDAGWRFYERCLVILKTVVEAENEMEDFKTGISGSVSVGFAPGVAKSILPQALTYFTKQYPQVDIDIASGNADSLLAATAKGNLDFYVGQFIEAKLGLTAVPIGQYPVALISGAQLGLKAMKPVNLAKVPSLKLFVPSTTNSLKPKIEDAIRKGEIKLERKISIDSLSAGIEFVSQTDWSAILPYWICLKELGNDRVTVNPIVKPNIEVDVALIYPTKKPLSKISKLFYKCFMRELEKTEQEWQEITKQGISKN